MLPSWAMARRRTRVSSFPTTSSSVWGRYLSIHGDSYPPFEDEEDGDFRLAVVLVELIVLHLYELGAMSDKCGRSFVFCGLVGNKFGAMRQLSSFSSKTRLTASLNTHSITV